MTRRRWAIEEFAAAWNACETADEFYSRHEMTPRQAAQRRTYAKRQGLKLKKLKRKTPKRRLTRTPEIPRVPRVVSSSPSADVLLDPDPPDECLSDLVDRLTLDVRELLVRLRHVRARIEPVAEIEKVEQEDGGYFSTDGALSEILGGVRDADR